MQIATNYANHQRFIRLYFFFLELKEVHFGVRKKTTRGIPLLPQTELPVENPHSLTHTHRHTHTGTHTHTHRGRTDTHPR